MRGLAGLGALLLAGCGAPAPLEPIPSGALPLEAKDNVFVPAELSVPAHRPVRIGMQNTGRAPHTFTIKQLDVDVNANSRKTALVTFTAPAPGRMQFTCTYHESIGMVGTITFR